MEIKTVALHDAIVFGSGLVEESFDCAVVRNATLGVHKRDAGELRAEPSQESLLSERRPGPRESFPLHRLGVGDRPRGADVLLRPDSPGYQRGPNGLAGPLGRLSRP